MKYYIFALMLVVMMILVIAEVNTRNSQQLPEIQENVYIAHGTDEWKKVKSNQMPEGKKKDRRQIIISGPKNVDAIKIERELKEMFPDIPVVYAEDLVTNKNKQ